VLLDGTVAQYVWLIALGFIVGTFGTLIGAGGGFVLVPLLLLFYPKEQPEIITSVSLAVVFFNALSGSFVYARMGRIDYRSGLVFALAATPGSILGAITTSYIPRRTFNMVFGIVMIVLSIFLVLRPHSTKETEKVRMRQTVRRQIVSADGLVHQYSYNQSVGIWLSVGVGYVSSLLGIGGGVIHVPALVRLLHFPVHVATATSHFILAIMAFTGTVVHVVTGAFHGGVPKTMALVIGVLFGAQLGARLSDYVKGSLIMRGLAVALGLVGVRLLFMAH
jgi:uncharacterized protein